MTDARTPTVGQFMNPRVVCLHPDQSVRSAEALLAERRVTGAPVVDDAGRPLGVVSQQDLIRHEARRATAGESGRFYTDVEDYREIAANPVDRSDEPVSAVMTRDVVSVERSTPLGEAAALLRSRRIHRLLVTDKGLLVGIVTAFDLLAALEHPGRS